MFWSKLKRFFRSVADVLKIASDVLLHGHIHHSELDVSGDGFVQDELTRHVQQIGDIEACGCRKCVKFLLRRNEQLEQENAEFRQIWARLSGPYKNPPNKLNCYVVRDSTGKKVK